MATWKKATAATTGVTVFINVDLVHAVFREKTGKSTTVRFAKDNKIDIAEEPIGFLESSSFFAGA
jgi:hypothetical protein